MTAPTSSPSPDVRLRLDPVSRVQVQVGYRERPEDPPREQYLLDLPLADVDETSGTAFDERPFLDALQPVVFAGTDVARHYSLHVHRWHTSWGPSTGAFEIGVTVTTGRLVGTPRAAAYDATAAAFRALLDLAGRPPTVVDSRDEAVARARRSVAAAYGVAGDALSLSAEAHHPDRHAWSIGLRAGHEDRYAVLLGLVDGFPGSVQVRHEPMREVSDSIGTE